MSATENLPSPPAPAPLRGEKLLKTAVNKIRTNPDCWDQQKWHCGTKHCIGGWIQILGGRPEDGGRVRQDVAELLDLPMVEADWLTDAGRTLVEIYNFAKNFTAGFDRFGFDRLGFDRFGFDRFGIDRFGFDRFGFDRFGRDRFGFDRFGRDRDGFDRFGRDRAGFDRDGFDRDGRDRAGTHLPLFEV